MNQVLDRFLRLVRCLAAAPRLHGVLFVDLDPLLLTAAGRWLADCAQAGGGGRPPVVTLGSWHTDDDLWSSVKFTASGLATGPGLIVETGSEPAPVFLVPDLSTASLAVRRAVVTTAGADTASSQRHGFSAVWQPRARWLAACHREALANLPAHLLDRFPIRCEAGGIVNPDRVSLDAADDEYELAWLGRLLGPPPLTGSPVFTAEALDRIIELTGPAPGMRRDIAFGRLSRALAACHGADTVSVSDVDAGAALLGVVPDAAPERVPDPLTQALEPEPEPAREIPDRRSRTEDMALVDGMEAEPVPLRSGGVPETLGRLEHAGPATAELFPEDRGDALSEPMALREWWHRHAGSHAARGQIIGSQRTKSLRDLAVLPTLLEAAKFRAVRSGGAGGLVIQPSDLRRHRRRPEPAAALVLVLDHSCHRGWDWAPALASYLRWAYTARAVVSLVEFGYRSAPEPLRADRYRARDLLDPRVVASLNREPGSASPLAHAIDLAADELRHLLRRRRSPVREALLLVVTDARGNVPFLDSTRGAVATVVGSRGVADANEAAKAVGQLRGVRAVVLTPDLAPYPHLAFDLAEALGGRVTSPVPFADQRRK
ncbi:hypothetical protein ACFQZ4_05570 [Catellatospora coxensis]|uniref:Magnesium chelatase n=1 Tax=Catellatospora coxensis TaxID=310354 RepID=A0A8J3KQP4_9ACTN|nr:hypothetical protein [Catellatospora coxensis]GIG05435.1 magnesium chelatase [Catellatospora coxensis]